MPDVRRTPTRGLLGLVALSTAFCVLAVPAQAAHNDAFPGEALSLNTFQLHSNVSASIQPPEALTRAESLCNDATGQGSSTTGQAMGSTLWWNLVGNGGTITVSTAGSDFDTLLAAWSGANFLGCDDDVLAGQGLLYSELRFNTVNGQPYQIQLGGLCTGFDSTAAENCETAEEGAAGIVAWTQPPNDARGSAEPVAAGGLVTRDNLGATEEGGEQTTCVTPGDDSPFGKTVWFRFDAPDKGVAHFTASGFDTVMAVYAGGSPNYLACDDDPNVSGPSQLNVDVARGGVYYVQVGGYGGGVVSRDGELTYGVTFDVDRDWDDDGVVGTDYGGPDCNDGNRDIKPGIADVEDNEVDENCDGLREYDADDDNYVAYKPVRTPAGYDCNDRNRRVNPGRREIRGNSVDENCDGRRTPASLISSRIDNFFASATGGARATRMLIRSVRAGSVIKARCKGPGCPFARKSKRVRRRAAQVNILGWFRGRVLGSGATLRISVLPPSGEWIGKTTLFRIQGSSVTTKAGCVNRRGRARRCPG